MTRSGLTVVAVLLGLARGCAAAQAVHSAAGEVSLPRVRDRARLAPHIPGIDSTWRTRVLVGGDSAQRIAMEDFGWRGRVASVEVDEEDGRVFWDVKIVPDSAGDTVVRYRIDATAGGILGIREFTGIPGLARRPRTS